MAEFSQSFFEMLQKLNTQIFTSEYAGLFGHVTMYPSTPNVGN
jgi:hypothetical protein